MISTRLIFVFVLLVACATAQYFYGTQEDKRNFDRDFMHFGKRSNYDADKRATDFDRNFMHFGKRFDFEPVMAKKDFNREFMHFGKRSSFNDDSLSNKKR
uniref:Uncharacterized protein n=1 Tax=Panagrolaimus sp. JU765 TaxID=591449 RepID=A0AC34QWJ6_9BILA